MKTALLFTCALLLSAASFSQDQRTTFDNVTLTATPTGTSVFQLHWTKGSEKVAYYLIERSTNGVDFRQCAVVMTSDDPEFVDYKFKDAAGNFSGTLYYRIGLVNEYRRLIYLPIRKFQVPG